jgi:hypothetical protein
VFGGAREELVEATAMASQEIRKSIAAMGHSRDQGAPLMDVAEQLSAMQVTMRDMMREPADVDSGYSLVDPRGEITEMVNAVNVLSDPDISVEFGRVRGPVRTSPGVKTAIGQVLLASVRHHRANERCVLHAGIEQRELVFTLGCSPSFSSWIVGTGDQIPFHRLVHCQSLVEEFGGTLKIGVPDFQCGDSFPRPPRPRAQVGGRIVMARRPDRCHASPPSGVGERPFIADHQHSYFTQERRPTLGRRSFHKKLPAR